MDSRKELRRNFASIRKQTETICGALCIEDYLIQGIPDVSPPKWHLAHTTWFFETFVLKQNKNYRVFDKLFHYLFNSYYKTVGNAYPRDKRGLLARPCVEKIYEYRKYVDDAMQDYIEHVDDEHLNELISIITLGLNHEQQHQELLLMDIKYNFSLDPAYPGYHAKPAAPSPAACKPAFIAYDGGIAGIGHDSEGFCFDNELPHHQYIIRPFSICDKLVTNAGYLEFIDACGYSRPELWLDDGWVQVFNNKWQAPQYWQKIDDVWYLFTLHGLEKLNPLEPVSHVSYYEADAYARFRGCRLPSEFEWEYCTALHPESAGNFAENSVYHPQPARHSASGLRQLFGDLWEWTASPYTPYPGYKPLSGSLGEYNGKFMNNQIVLRGGSCVTPHSHMRASYRNFFQQDKRWQFSGIRLGKDI